MATFETFKDKTASQKIVLATIDASRRLKGWELVSGTRYKLSDFDEPKVISLEKDGTALTEVASLSLMGTNKWFNDRTNQILYVDAGVDITPVTVFISIEFRQFFSNSGVREAYDLATGEAVYWRPIIDKTSDFGPRGDIQRQTGQSIEGSGSITFLMDDDYWRSRYDKFYWDNKPVRIYSWSTGLDISEAKLLFRGRVSGRSFSPGKSVNFKLKDAFFDLRRVIPQTDIGDVAGSIVESSEETYKQRLVYGELTGHRPMNIDQVLADTGYTLTGTVSVTNGSTTMTGSGTSFLTELSPNDEILIEGLVDERGDQVTFTIESIASDTSAVLTEDSTRTLSGADLAVRPAQGLPKRYTNRIWVVADHMREPSTTIEMATAVNLMTVVDGTDFEADARINVGGENVTIRRVGPDGEIRLDTNLLLPPAFGTTVKRLSVFDVYINNTQLFFGDHYTYDANAGTMTLLTTAERDIAPTRTLNGTITFNGTRAVTGSGTTFLSQLTSNSWIKLDSDTEFTEVLSIESDTALTLRSNAPSSGSSSGKYKNPAIFNPETDVLSVSVLGGTEDGTKTGTWIKTASGAIRDVLSRIGIAASDVNEASFTSGKSLAAARIGLSIPDKYDSSTLVQARDVINRLNESVFSSLIQNDDMDLQYNVLSPKKVRDESLEIDEDDVLSLKIESKGDAIIKDINLSYAFKEYDRFTGDSSHSLSTVTSKEGEYLAKTERVFEVDSVLQKSRDALIFARRWSFLLSFASNVVDVNIKMRGIDLIAGSRVKIDHDGLYDRMASPTREKIAAVVSARKDAKGVSLEMEDLSNALTRCGVITDNDAEPYDTTLSSDLIYQGFITDDSGLMSGDVETDGISVIW